MKALKGLGKNAMVVVYFLLFIIVVVLINKFFGEINNGLLITFGVLVFLDRTREDVIEYLNGKKKE